jgi:hypothetical protein
MVSLSSELLVWFIVTFIYKLALSASVSLCAMGSVAQLVLLLFILALFVFGHALVSPFANSLDNMMFLVLSLVSLLTFSMACISITAEEGTAP